MAYVLAIDLGTTFTAAAVIVNGRAEIVGLGNHAATIPSVVFLREDGELIIGDAASRRGHLEPDRIGRQFKRRFGDATPILLGTTPYSAERLTAIVLNQVAAQVAERYGGPPDAVVIAHPANWGPYKTDLLRQAAQLAQLSGARFVTEPEAAAAHFAATERLEVGDLIAVYDLGGGTFDAAVLRRTSDGFETVGEPEGIERLGGIDFDEAVLAHVRATVGDGLTGVDHDDPGVRAAMGRLREECVAAKEALSEDSETSIPVALPGRETVQVRLTRAELEASLRPALRETVDSLRRAITNAGLTVDDIKAVVLAGGSSRIPLVNELVRELGRPVVLDAHPKYTVALGAAGMTEPDGRAPAPPQPVAPPEQPPPGPPPAPPEQSPEQPPADQHRTAPAREASETRPRRKRPPVPVLIGAGLAAAAAAVTVFLLLGAREDDPEQTATTDTTAVTPTSATGGSPSQECESSSGRCVFIDEITEDDEGLVVAYSTTGYQPRIADRDEDQFHIHFFFDTVALNDAGVPGDGPWTVWDTDPEGRMLFRGEPGVQRDEIPRGATEICAVAATHDHRLDEDPQPSCMAIPGDGAAGSRG